MTDRAFEIVRERSPAPSKDTGRLLAAGADPVFWVRSDSAHLERAFLELAGEIDPGTPILVESCRLRLVVEPGLFLLFDRDPSETKASSMVVRDLADAIVRFDGCGFSPDPEDVGLVAGRWTLQIPATAVILAGGESRRFGSDKRFVPVAGVPLLARVHSQLVGRFREILVSANDPDRFLGLDATLVPDSEPGLGPLGGIASALERASSELVFVTACDVPEIDLRLVRRMVDSASEADVVVPRRVDTGRIEPLFAVFRRSIRPSILAALGRGERRIISFFPEVRVRELPLDDSQAIGNINTRDEYERYLCGRE